jgi:polyisoprenoid-binding protein YceI
MADMSLTRRNILITAAAMVALAAAAFAGVYLTMFNPRAVSAVALPTPSPIASSSPGASPAALGATWSVGGASFVGYRVREQLATLPAPSDAVGRSRAVTGSASVVTNVDGSATVSSISVRADLSQLASDSGRRDNFVRQNYLETSRFPDAAFVSSEAFTVPASVVSGGAGTATVKGRFTIHGVTRQVSIPLQLQRSGTSVNVVGSYKFAWGDFGVEKPQVPVASVQSDPTIEISLVLSPA